MRKMLPQDSHFGEHPGKDVQAQLGKPEETTMSQALRVPEAWSYARSPPRCNW